MGRLNNKNQLIKEFKTSKRVIYKPKSTFFGDSGNPIGMGNYVKSKNRSKKRK